MGLLWDRLIGIVLLMRGRWGRRFIPKGCHRPFKDRSTPSTTKKHPHDIIIVVVVVTTCN
jgi:hypothetical protein